MSGRIVLLTVLSLSVVLTACAGGGLFGPSIAEINKDRAAYEGKTLTVSGSAGYSQFGCYVNKGGKDSNQHLYLEDSEGHSISVHLGAYRNFAYGEHYTVTGVMTKGYRLAEGFGSTRPTCWSIVE